MRLSLGRLGAVAGIVALFVGGLVVSPQAGAARPQATVCATRIVSGTITGDFTVANTSICSLTTATVTGSVIIGTFAILYISHSYVARNISGNSANTLIQFSTVGGTIAIGAHGDLGLPVDTVGGNISIGYDSSLGAVYSTISGNLSTDSSFVVTLDTVDVSGNASFHDTLGTVSFTPCSPTSPMCSLGSTYSGSVTTHPQHPFKLSNVSITTTQGVAAFIGNHVSGNLSCSGNITMVAYTNTVTGHASGQCATAASAA